MKLTTFVRTQEDLDECAAASLVSEVLIEPAETARLGELSLAEAVELARKARTQGLSPVFVWDIIMTEEVLCRTLASLREVDFTLFAAIRVFDLGAAWWSFQHLSVPIQLICEVANKNLSGFTGWGEVFGERLSRLILSHELPEPLLGELRPEIQCEVEVLGAGRIELFYSPRSLLRENFSSDSGLVQVRSRTPESPAREYPTIESNHGTLMYLHRDRFVLDRVAQLQSVGVDVLRLDLRHLGEKTRAADGVSTLAAQVARGEVPEWPVAHGAPFRHSNKTTRRFKKLRSTRAGVRGEYFIGEVVSCEKPRYTIFRSFQPTPLEGPFKLISPEGHEQILETIQFRSVANNEERSQCGADEVLVTPWIKRANPGALLFKYLAPK